MQTEEEEVRVTGARLLIVDDDPRTCETLSDIFMEKGCDVHTSGTGRDALRKAEETSFHAALIDIRLPDMDGTELLKRFKDDYPWMVCCIITGHASLQNAVAALKEGASGYFLKPLIMEEVIHRLEEALEKQRLEQELKESEERYRGLVETSTDAIISINEKAEIIQWNEAASRLFGYSREEATGRAVDILIPEKYGQRHSEGFKRCLKTGECKLVGRTVELEGLRKDGSLVPVGLSLSMLKRKGTYVFTGIIRDITKRKQAEVALRESRDSIQSIIDSLGDPTMAIDPSNYRIVLANAAAREMASGEDPVAGAMTCYQLSHHRDRPCDGLEEVCPLPEVVTKRAPVRVTHIHYDTDGKKVFMDVMGTPVLDKKGEVVQVIESCRDITDFKKAEEAIQEYARDLEEANSLKDLFTDIMRHDLLNPAGIVRTVSEMLLEKETDPEKRDLLAMVKNSSSKLIDMIENASLYSHIEEMDEITTGRDDLGRILETSIRDFTDLLKEKGMVMDHLPVGEYPAMVNPMVENVFSNLVSNAIKYSPEGGRIKVDVQDRGEDWVVHVKDWGEGIPDEYKERLFTRFERLGKEGVKGTGLGLAIAKRIVDLHKGKIWVEDNPDGGSIFFVSLPKEGPGDKGED
jgi:PAS domain S-box-containing protein